MSQLTTRCAFALLCATLLASVAGLLALGPLPDGLAKAAQPDGALPSPLAAAALHLPLLIAAAAGWRQAQRRMADANLQRAWMLAFATAGLAAAAGLVQALAPGGVGMLPPRLATGSAAALLALIFLAERLNLAWVRRPAVLAALASGPLAGALAGLGLSDLRGLLWLEHLPLLLLPLGVWGLRSRGLGGGDWLVALLAYAAGRLLVWADAPLSPAGGPGSAALQPLLLAASVGWLAWALARQRLGGAEFADSADGASQRSTSLNTAG